MATRTISNAGGNWSAAGTWAEGVKPTAADEVVCTGTSGNITINEYAYCRSIDLTGYTGTVAWSSSSSLYVGDGTTPTGMVSIKLAGTWTNGQGTTLYLCSTAAGVHTVDFANKNLGYTSINISQNASYQLLDSFSIQAPYLFTITNGSLDLNGKTISCVTAAITGSSAKTLNFNGGKFVLSCESGSGRAWDYSGSNLTITNNSGTIQLTAASQNFWGSNGVYNGITLLTTGSSGGCYVYGDPTFHNIIIAPTTTKTFSINATNTVTVNNNFWCFGTNGKITITGNATYPSSGRLSKSSGTVKIYNTDITSMIFTGGATWQALNNSTIDAGTTGISNGRGKWCCDYENGDDSTTATPYGWWSVAYTGAEGTAPIDGETCTGGSSGSTAKVMGKIDLYEWSVGSGTLYFFGKSAAFSAEQVNLGTGGGHFHIAGDFTYCAWKTSATGGLSTRVASGDELVYVKSEVPSSMGHATWTVMEMTTSRYTTNQNIGSSTNATPITITMSTNNYCENGDWILIVGHNVNTNANGFWRVVNKSGLSFDLEGSVGNGIGAATGTVSIYTARGIELETSQNLLINNADTLWTPAGAAGTALTAYGTDCKFANNCNTITLPASPSVITKYAYFTLPASLNLSGFQKLTFWFKSVSLANTTTNDTLRICLCDDTTGDSVRDIFKIPLWGGGGKWFCMTLVKDGGGDMYNGINSIAVYSGANISTSVYTLRVQNFNACTSSGLTLNHLISKSSASIIDTEGWYPIGGIFGKFVVFDYGTTSINPTSSGIRGYDGSTDHVTSYMRNTIKTTPTSSSSTSVFSISEDSVPNEIIHVSGGWDKTTAEQNGTTVIDGQTGNGYGVYIDRRYGKFSNFLTCRYNVGFYLAGAGPITVNVASIGSTTYNFYITAYYASIHFKFSLNSGSDNISLAAATSCEITGTKVANTAGTASLNLAQSFWNRMNIDILRNTTTYHFYSNSSDDNHLTNCVMSLARNSEGAIITGRFHVINCDWQSSSDVAYSSGNARVFAHNYNATEGDHRMFGFGSHTFVSTVISGERHTTSGLAWDFYTHPNTYSELSPSKYPIAVITCDANVPVTANIWVKKSEATLVHVRLVCRKNQLKGLTDDISVTAANNTDWQKLSITILVTEPGVVELELHQWQIGSSIRHIYVDDFSLS